MRERKKKCDKKVHSERKPLLEMTHKRKRNQSLVKITLGPGVTSFELPQPISNRIESLSYKHKLANGSCE